MNLWYTYSINKQGRAGARNTRSASDHERYELSMATPDSTPFSSQMKTCKNGANCVHANGPTLPSTRDYFYYHKNSADGFQYECIECDKARKKKRRATEDWKRHSREYKRRYRKGDKSKQQTKEYRKRYRSTSEGRAKRRIEFMLYKSRKLSLPDKFTVEDWQRVLDYFHGCCAVCGRQLNDLFGEHTAAMDHWIPLSSPDCPGTIPTNIVPLCHGITGCNNSKGNKDPEKWLQEQFGKRKAHEILHNVETYFESVKKENMA